MFVMLFTILENGVKIKNNKLRRVIMYDSFKEKVNLKGLTNNCSSEDWEFLTDFLTYYLKKVNRWGYVKVEVSNFGWKKSNAIKYIHVKDGEDLLYKILPNTECEFEFHYNQENKSIEIRNYHHDNSTGSEVYTVTATKKGDVGHIPTYKNL